MKYIIITALMHLHFVCILHKTFCINHTWNIFKSTLNNTVHLLMTSHISHLFWVTYQLYRLFLVFFKSRPRSFNVYRKKNILLSYSYLHRDIMTRIPTCAHIFVRTRLHNLRLFLPSYIILIGARR